MARPRRGNSGEMEGDGAGRLARPAAAVAELFLHLCMWQGKRLVSRRSTLRQRHLASRKGGVGRRRRKL